MVVALAVSTMVGLAMLVAACGSSPAVEATRAGSTSVPPTTESAPGTTAERLPVGTEPAIFAMGTDTEHPILTIRHDVGAPYTHVADEAVAIAVYADGRVVRRAGGGVRLDYVVNRIDQVELQHLLDRAKAGGVFSPGADFGDPGITDQGSLVMSFTDGSTAGSVAAYAFGLVQPGGEFEPSEWLESAQANRRAVMAELIAGLVEPGDEMPYVPDRVAVEITSASADTVVETDTPQWPTELAAEFGFENGCHELTGEQYVLLAEFAGSDDLSQGEAWVSNGVVRLVFTSVWFGEPGAACSGG